MVWSADYSPFGKATVTSQGPTFNLRFPGQYFDVETGLHYNWHRYYDPRTGRYITSDPIGLAGGVNTYTYGLNNPITFYDPYGLWAIGDPLPQGFVDFSAGAGDALLLGFGDNLRDFAGVDGVVNECSSAYQAGGWASFSIGGARVAYAVVAKVGSLVASSGAAASTFRANLKTTFRGGVGRNWRPPNLASKTDEQLRRSAGKTNFGVNSYGAGVAGTGAGAISGCGCENDSVR